MLLRESIRWKWCFCKNALMRSSECVISSCRAPDMVNPDLESWEGNVLVDLAYTGWRVSIGHPIRPGAVEINPQTFKARDPAGVVLLGSGP